MARNRSLGEQIVEILRSERAEARGDFYLTEGDTEFEIKWSARQKVLVAKPTSGKMTRKFRIVIMEVL